MEDVATVVDSGETHTERQHATADGPLYVNTRQLAGWLGVTQETCRKWAAEGVFPGARKGGPKIWLIPTSEVVREFPEIAKRIGVT